MYAKLFESIYMGTLRGNAHGLLVFTNLLAHADRLGGVDIHPRAIADEVGLDVDAVRAALLMLEAPDAESRSPELEGRRIVRTDAHRPWGWTIVNYAKYRAIRNEDDRREQNRQSQARFRAKNKPASADGKQDKPQKAHAEAEGEGEADAGPPAEAGGKAPRKRSAAPPKPRRVAGAGDVAMPVGVTEQTWRDWCALRSKKKAPVTATVVERAIGEAELARLTIEEFLQVWCFRGSQGLQAEWLTPNDLARLPGRNGGHVNKQAALEASNAAVGDAWLAKQMAKGDHAPE